MSKESQAEEPKIKHNALSKFVRQECANWQGGKCIGVDVWGDARFSGSYKCWVMIGKPCKHFKDCVLGPEDNRYPHLRFIKDPALENRVRKQYRQIDYTVVEAKARRCPDCGAPLRPRQRYCEKCKKKRRRKTDREAHRKIFQKQRDGSHTVNENAVLLSAL